MRAALQNSDACIDYGAVLSSDINPSDPSLVDITDENDMPSNARIEEYGYASDSDLDDDDEGTPSIPTADARPRKDWPARVSTSPPKISVANQPKDDDERVLYHPPDFYI